MEILAVVKAVKRAFLRKIEFNDGYSAVQETDLHLSREDRLRQMIRLELFQRGIDHSAETFEEADDFELDDGTDWVSPYEETFDPPSVTAEPGLPAVDPPPAVSGVNETLGGADAPNGKA